MISTTRARRYDRAKVNMETSNEDLRTVGISRHMATLPSLILGTPNYLYLVLRWLGAKEASRTSRACRIWRANLASASASASRFWEDTCHTSGADTAAVIRVIQGSGEGAWDAQKACRVFAGLRRGVAVKEPISFKDSGLKIGDLIIVVEMYRVMPGETKQTVLVNAAFELCDTSIFNHRYGVSMFQLPSAVVSGANPLYRHKKLSTTDTMRAWDAVWADGKSNVDMSVLSVAAQAAFSEAGCECRQDVEEGDANHIAARVHMIRRDDGRSVCLMDNRVESVCLVPGSDEDVVLEFFGEQSLPFSNSPSGHLARSCMMEKNISSASFSLNVFAQAVLPNSGAEVEDTHGWLRSMRQQGRGYQRNAEENAQLSRIERFDFRMMAATPNLFFKGGYFLRNYESGESLTIVDGLMWG